MNIPRVVIVGRPNVGKSSLLNTLARRRVSIVEPTAGVTRDRVAAYVELPPEFRGAPQRVIELVDTGGYGVEDSQNLTPDIERQISVGLAHADLILFVVDAQTGVVPLDETVARLLRKTNPDTPIILIANKVDASRHEADAYNLMTLGFGEPVMVSATTKHNLHDLFDTLHERIDFDALGSASAEDEGVKLAIVGKRNAGKSTLVNALAGEARVIVSEVEGTTRDSVDVRVEVELLDDDEPPAPTHTQRVQDVDLETEFNTPASATGFDEFDGEDDDEQDRPTFNPEGFENVVLDPDGVGPEDEPEHVADLPVTDEGRAIFTLIDTAGMRKRKSLQNDIEYYSMHRSLRSIRRADVVVHVIDATLKVSNVDQQLIGEIVRHDRPLVLVINKWDEVGKGDVKGAEDEAEAQAKFAEYLDGELRSVRFAPIVFTSALNADGVTDVLAIAASLWRQARHRVGTGELNRVIGAITDERSPRSRGGKMGKIFFARQPAVDPPTIVLQVNSADVFDNNYQLFMLNRMRDALPFSEVPIKLIFRGKERRYSGKK